MRNFIFIYGPPAVGKTTLGKALSEQLHQPFIDLDTQIEKDTGQTIPDLFAAGDEKRFREIEKETLHRILSEGRGIISLGGGTLLDRESRDLVTTAGQVICLYASSSTLASRLDDIQAGQRPLLHGDRREHLENLLRERFDHYASFALKVDTDSNSIEQVLWELQRLSGMFRINEPGYESLILARPGILDDFGDFFSDLVISSRKIILVADQNVGHIYRDRVSNSIEDCGYRVDQIEIPAGEEHKTLETVSLLWDAFIKAKIERNGMIVALGGGVTSDVAGFAAATFMRGVQWAVIPTSLLGMVDAGLGGKTGIDLPLGKNLVGAFHAPKLVVVDPLAVLTLPEIEIRNGVAEIIKSGVICEPELFNECSAGLDRKSTNWNEVIKRAMAVKIRIIQQDPFEKGLRASLNFGHTIGHGLELLTGFNLCHGHAVAIGMVAEARLAERSGVAKPGVEAIIKDILVRNHLPTSIPSNINRLEIFRALQVDKKRHGGVVRFSLPVEIGKVKIGIEIPDLEKMIEIL